MSKESRPISPHLQIYKPQLTSMLSILHRLTGIALSFALFVFVAWLYGVAACPLLYAFLTDCFSHWIGMLFLWGILFSFWYHMANGVRHLVWDIGKNLGLQGLYSSGYFVLILSTAFTIFSIIVIWLM